MKLKNVVKLFKKANVCVFGLKGCGKDMLMSNVCVRRKKPYISNIDYGGQYIPLNLNDIAVGGNTYKNFISGDINSYVYPYKDGTDIYISDSGIYFPSQYCNELNRDYKQFPVFVALSRQIGDCNFHFNTQALNRVWDKFREQSDTYILCKWCFYIPFLKLTIQGIRIYDKYESAIDKRCRLRTYVPLGADKMTKAIVKNKRLEYQSQHGSIKDRILIYFNKSSYDTRRFKSILKGEK